LNFKESKIGAISIWQASISSKEWAEYHKKFLFSSRRLVKARRLDMDRRQDYLRRRQLVTPEVKLRGNIGFCANNKKMLGRW